MALGNLIKAATLSKGHPVPEALFTATVARIRLAAGMDHDDSIFLDALRVADQETK